MIVGACLLMVVSVRAAPYARYPILQGAEVQLVFSPATCSNKRSEAPVDLPQPRDLRRWENLVGPKTTVRLDIRRRSPTPARTPHRQGRPAGRTRHAGNRPHVADRAQRPATAALCGFTQWRI